MNKDIIKTTILSVEDDVQIRNFIKFALESNDYNVIVAGSYQEAMDAYLANHIDMILLDLGLPDVDGMEMLVKIREFSTIPIVVVSARDQDKEKVNALDNGADDYLVKPFSAAELLARIRLAFRHCQSQSEERKYAIKELVLDPIKHLVYLNDSELHVTPLEYRLLSLFFKNIGKVLTNSFIIKEIYGSNYGDDTSALRTLMAGLRRKIEENPAKPKYIITEIGVGYRMIDE